VVDLGEENENFVLLSEGLNEGDELLLNTPENPDEIALRGMDIYEKIKERVAKEEEEDQKAMEEEKNESTVLNNQPPVDAENAF